MDAKDWESVQEWLDRALALEPEERAALLRELEGEDPALRREVEELLAYDRDDDGFLEPDAAVALASREVLERVGGEGSRLGSYRLERRIGVGGIGEVYLASRVDGAFDAHVAIKLVKRGMDSEAIVRRFERERQVLADLDHPGIARLTDGGTAPDGRPFLVMEYVEGTRIDDFCRDRALPLRERLVLFRRLCEAVEHAHRRGVLHRDIKPGNVLVTEDGRPKLLDFGLAKLLHPSAPQALDPTATQDRLLTPQYASPEQCRGRHVGPATDVYALGVVMYETLLGRRPYEIDTASWAEIEHIVCTRDPEPPRQVLRQRGEGTAAIAADWDADLDTILLECLRKEPERRYASVRALSDDLGRFLEGRPVVARRDTVRYRVSKFVRRHRGAVLGATGAVVLVAIAGALVSEVLREGREVRAQAAEQVGQTREMSRQLLHDVNRALFSLPGSLELQAGIVESVKDQLESLAVGSDDPELQADLAQVLVTLGDAQGRPYARSLGRTVDATASYERALEITVALGGADATNPEVAQLHFEIRRRLASVASILGETVRSEELYRATLVDLRRARELRPEASWVLFQIDEVLANLAVELDGQLRFDEARDLFEDSESRARRAYAAHPDDPHIKISLATSLLGAGIGFRRAGHHGRAVGPLRESIEHFQRIVEGHQEWTKALARGMFNLGYTLVQIGLTEKRDEPIEEGTNLLEDAVRLCRELEEREPDDSAVLMTLQNALFMAGRTYDSLGMHAEALPHFEDCRALRQRLSELASDAHGWRVMMAEVIDMVAWCQVVLEQPEDAIERLAESAAIFEQALERSMNDGRMKRAIAVNAYYRGVAGAKVVASDAPADERRRGYMEAHDFFEQSRDMLVELDSENRLTGVDRSMIAMLERNMALCEEKIADLSVGN